jgi:hypothetical protein
MLFTMLFGPILFVLHTYCYETTAVKLFTKTGMTFYKPCPRKKGEVHEEEAKVDLRKKHPVIYFNLEISQKYRFR